MNVMLEAEKNKAVLDFYRSIGRKGGLARYKKYGKKAMQDMAHKRWKSKRKEDK